jgi:hypothetical protein
METFYSPHQAIDLSTPLYYQLVYTLTGLLPPPLDDTQDALRARNLAAIAKVAALAPVNANEADLAAQCIAAQYGSMVRTSLSVHARLMRVQALRHKREANEGAANQDAWVQHIAERSMLGVVDPDAAKQQVAPPAWPGEAPPTWPGGVHPAWFGATEVEAPAVCGNQETAENVSENRTNSRNAAFETRMSATPWNGEFKGSGKTGPRDVVHGLFARSRLAAARESAANGGETPGWAP